jgi:FkbM family methyltransferase
MRWRPASRPTWRSRVTGSPGSRWHSRERFGRAGTASMSAQTTATTRSRWPMRPGRNGRVVPIEPTPRLTDLLRQTLDINGFPHVEVVSKAPSEADGQTLQLVVPERRSLNARLAEAVAASEEAVAVAAVTVDTLTADWLRIDLIKIDVEGAEEAVWRGMARTLADNPTIVVVLKFNAAPYDDRRRRFSGRSNHPGSPSDTSTSTRRSRTFPSSSGVRAARSEPRAFRPSRAARAHRSRPPARSRLGRSLCRLPREVVGGVLIPDGFAPDPPRPAFAGALVSLDVDLLVAERSQQRAEVRPVSARDGASAETSMASRSTLERAYGLASSAHSTADAPSPCAPYAVPRGSTWLSDHPSAARP